MWTTDALALLINKVKAAVPTKVSDLVNDAGFITASGAPVQSVNGQTGDVTALPLQPAIDTIRLSGGVSPFGSGYATSTTNVRVFIPLPNNANGASVTYTGTITLASTSGTLQISAMSVYQIYRNGVWLAITTSGVTSGTPVVLKGAAGSSLIIRWS